MKVDSAVRTTLIILFVVVVFIISVLVVENQKNGEVSFADKEKLRGIQTALANLQNELKSVKSELLVKEDRQSEITTIRLGSSSNQATGVVVSREDKTFRASAVDVNVPLRAAVKRAVIFTMDSIGSYEQSSLVGGAAGELTVRKSLQFALNHYGVQVTVIDSDARFNACNMKDYDFVILDPWTWAAKGWVPKANIVGSEERVYILDFFGSKGGLRKPLSGQGGLNVPPHRILTAFGSPVNTFLGYYMQEKNTSVRVEKDLSSVKLKQGMVWGKDAKHFVGADKLLKAVADDVKLVSTASVQVFAHRNVHWAGHQNAAGWTALLRQSRFLIGLGNPILGPSAIDAISVGCMFLNPQYEHPVQHNGLAYASQHPFAAEEIGAPYVCNYRQHDVSSLKECVRQAMTTNLTPRIPPQFTMDAYLKRVKSIFKL